MAVNTNHVTAKDRKELRENLVKFLVNLVGPGISWTDGRFFDWTQLNQATLLQHWRSTPPKWTTSCNSFAQKVAAKALGVPLKLGGLTGCSLDLSGAGNEVPGSWIWNDAAARERHLHPMPGDFYCSSRWDKGWLQKWAHVGIVTKCESWDSPWEWVAGGQGKPPNDDWIRPGPDTSRTPGAAMTFAAASPMVVGWVDIGKYMFPDENPPTDRPGAVQRPYAFMPTHI